MPTDINNMNDFTLQKYYMTSLKAKRNKNGLSFALLGRKNTDFTPKFQF